jgi:hypothetical protein
MAEQSFPFENIDTTESQFSEWATNFQETGVQGSPTGTELGITVTGSDLNLTIAAGQAFIRGHYYINTDNLVLAVPSAGVNTRIDIVVVELDPEANTIVTKIVSGTAVASAPVAPTLTQSATGIYQLPIATLTIPASTVVITAGMLLDTRTFMGNRVGIWTTATRPANPTAYQTLGYNTTIGSHESWNGTGWVGFFDPISTAGDLVVGDETGQASRLGIGADDQVLTVVSGAPAWADGGGGGNYYNITAAGTYTVSLESGLYSVASTDALTVGGVTVNGNLGLVNYASGVADIVASSVLDSWTNRTSGFGSNAIFGVAYNDNFWVAVGVNGTMTTSTDGVSWTNRTSGFGSSAITSIVYGDNLWVAVGELTKIATSPDGITWTLRSNPFDLNRKIETVAYGNGLYVAAGYGGQLITSPDGITWTDRTTGLQDIIYGVGYGNGLYLAVGADYIGGWLPRIITSPDGINWTIRSNPFGSDRIMTVAYGNGLYVAAGQGGQLVTSPDGITWTSRSSGFSATEIRDVAFVDGSWIAVGLSGKITISPDGVNWTNWPSNFGSTNIFSVAYGEDLYIIVGNSGTMSTSSGSLPFSTFLSMELKAPITILS